MRKNRKPWSARLTLFNAVIWTLAAAAWGVTLAVEVQNAFQVLVAVLFTATAVLDWITYFKKRKEETGHEENKTP